MVDALSPESEEHLEASLQPKPEMFVPYEIQDKVAHGGMGINSRARNPQLQRMVAIKALLLGGRAGPEVIERFNTSGTVSGARTNPHQKI